jgi:hypothetical protein
VAREEMNGTTWRLMNGCIAEMPKLSIWSDNTYKQKIKPKWNGRVGARGGESGSFSQKYFLRGEV